MTIYINKTQDNISSTPMVYSIKEWSNVWQIIKSYPNSFLFSYYNLLAVNFSGGR